MFTLYMIWFSIFPMIMLGTIGWLLDSHFRIDINTYKHLLHSVVLPLFVFTALYLAPLHSSYIWLIAAWILWIVIVKLFCYASCKAAGVAKTVPASGRSSLENLGLLGIPFILILYQHEPFMIDWKSPFLETAAGAAAVLYFVNSLISRLLAVHDGSQGDTFRSLANQFLSIPSLYSLLAVMAVKYFHIPLEHTFVWPVIVHFNGALVVLILISIGVAFHRNFKISHTISLPVPLLVSQCIAAPLIALAVLYIISLPPAMSQVFLIVSVLPISSMLPAWPFLKNESANSLFISSAFFSLLALIIWASAAEMLFPILH